MCTELVEKVIGPEYSRAFTLLISMAKDRLSEVTLLLHVCGESERERERGRGRELEKK